MNATTPNVVKSNVESKSPKAPNRSPMRPPAPVTYDSKPSSFANGVKSSRNASTIAGRTGSSFGSTSAIAAPSRRIEARTAVPSGAGKAVTWLPGNKYLESGISVPPSFRSGTVSRCALICCRTSGPTVPSSKTKVGKAVDSPAAKLSNNLTALVDSALSGKNAELSFS